MARARPNVFTVPPGLDFARVTVEALLAGHLFPLGSQSDPFHLADLVLYVPTRRAGLAFQQAFLALGGRQSVVLPEIRPLAEPGDALEQLLAEAGDDGFIAGENRRITPLERAFRLRPAVAEWQARIVERRRADGENAPPPALAETLHLAEALGRLIDEMAIEGQDLARLATITPDEYDPSRFDDYWSLTRDFLSVAARDWPEICARLSVEDEMAARLRRIRQEARRLARQEQGRPVLVAGSTGSVRATAELMRVVSRLEQGAVILPGLDQRLDAQSWALVGSDEARLPTRFAHPQAVLKRTLALLGLNREDVRPLGQEPSALAARNALLSEAMRPAETSARWLETRAHVPIAKALDGMTLAEAHDEREEARLIAILMRQTLETPDAQAALVTADRALARRVALELETFGIMPDISDGATLAGSEAGLFARLFLAAAEGGRSAELLALLRHPASRFGFEFEELRSLVHRLEIVVARQHRFDPALPWAGRVRAVMEGQPPLWPWGKPAMREELEPLATLAATLDRAFAPFLPRAGTRPLADMVRDLRATIDDVSQAFNEAFSGAERLEDALETLIRFGKDLRVTSSELLALIEQRLGATPMPPEQPRGARARILGFLEARLLHADRVILGGLNEGSVPPAVAGDPFLNRSMRLGLGIQPGERRIGQAAHDVTMLAGTTDLVLTRAKRVGTAPSLPSRFLLRLAAFAGPDMWKGEVVARGEACLKALRALDDPGARVPAPPPRPVPGGRRIPQRISITEVETLFADPYALYARRILQLEPLGAIDPPPDARDRGTILHRVLERFTRELPAPDAEQAAQRLRAMAADELRMLASEPELKLFWERAFEAMLPGFLAYEAEARARAQLVIPEARAEKVLHLPSGARLTLTGKADRIEIDARGFARIVDYKTGTPPNWSAIETHTSPQLTLTARLLQDRAFAGLPDIAGVSGIAYLPIGGRQPVLPVHADKAPADFAALVEAILPRLVAELDALATGQKGYDATLRPKRNRGEEGIYDHLARLGEWLITGARDEGGDEA
ncbi:MAG: double-strand break repair protein AddB [Methylobacterium sp.]|nr:double-strand break repair protein AddB [Methylobacterium sp.]MCA3659021.1 double-strand break repair protein AddB [Methylobacterium sp.]MCA3664689.1 double-strand break repair protein AddB [Methylobacterium sp.]MCA3670795.1 double-strand break repair protein AddB [Methylobacterium sp.]MCA3677959.1 double-strand break repair protein AddB [Methylobacterium sp.]